MNSQIKSKPYIVKTVCYKGIPSGPQGFRKIIQNGFYNDVPSASSEHSFWTADKKLHTVAVRYFWEKINI